MLKAMVVGVFSLALRPSTILFVRSFQLNTASQLSKPRTFHNINNIRQMSLSTKGANDASKSEHGTDDCSQNESVKEKQPLYLAEGIFSVEKPKDWTSNDVVSYIRGILEREAKSRGLKVSRPGKRRRGKNSNTIKVGHGGTLDPLATGVLVIGVGSGTKNLQNYLKGGKRYVANARFGEETDTLDTEGKIIKTVSTENITVESIQDILPQFRGDIMQVPPVFSALKKDGKKLYEEARKGKTAEDLGIEARPVVINELELIENPEERLPCFSIDVNCGGGTYIRSLIRDIAHALDSCAVMTGLKRTQQGQYSLDDALQKDDWSAESIYKAIRIENEKREQQQNDSSTEEVLKKQA